jgi:predicted RecB family nuclease
MTDKAITSEVFVAYSQCPRKAFLLLFSHNQGTPHDHLRILEERRKAHQTQYLEAFKQSHENAKLYNEKNLREGEIFVEAILKAECWEAHCDVLMKVDQGSPNRKVMYEPMIIVGNYSITKEQKTELLFVGKVLGQIQKQLPTTGKIVGMDGKTHRVKLEGDYKSIAPFLKTLQAWMEEKPAEPPALILNKHCPSCQFQQTCRTKAKEIDHLSLLAGITEREIKKLNSKGIFTVTQLSYTYRARKQGKTNKNRKSKYYHSLKSLAIRDNQIYVVRKNDVDLFNTLIFLDIEGVPDQDFYYLIGLVIIQDGTMQEFSFWADNKSDEIRIWRQLIEIISSYEHFTIFHYGSYEAHFFKSRAEIYCEDEDLVLKKIQSRLVNVLSLIYGNIYFPTYSNGLKDIGKYLGGSWSEGNSSGIQSLVWRYNWERTKNNIFKERLIEYNREDCLVLKRVTEAIDSIFNGDQKSRKNYEFICIDKIVSDSMKNEFILEEFDFINKCSYFDYQREKIYFREENKKRRIKTAKKTGRAEKLRINKEIFIPKPEICPQCGNSKLNNSGFYRKIVFDIKFFEFGMKRQIIRYTGCRGKCMICKNAFYSDTYLRINSKYSENFYRAIVYKMIGLRQSYDKIIDDFSDVFKCHISHTLCSIAKKKMAKYYEATHNAILDKLINGRLLHVDETPVSIKGEKSYIWVFTSLEEVVFLYSPTREGDFLKGIINGFKGVLVSDFYAAYESIECPQQKCLIHLIRDMNDDLRSNSFDEEYKAFIQDFSVLLKSIVITIDAYGLKKRNLGKHIKEVEHFFRKYMSKDWQSETLLKYIKKFTKFKDSLFTFLNHDNISWNNNNAEHAIKAFAAYRNMNDGTLTESGIRQYLILLSIHETCKCKDINFLEFLLSGETDIDNFKCRRRSSVY